MRRHAPSARRGGTAVGLDRPHFCLGEIDSRQDCQLPDVLSLEHVGGVPKRRGEAVGRELRILRENLLLRRAARGKLEQEFDAEARAANTGLVAEYLRVGVDQIFSHCHAHSTDSLLSRTVVECHAFTIAGMARRTRLVYWNAKDLPAGFRNLPAGRYLVEAVDGETPVLEPDEEAGIEAALESYRRGRVVDAKRAREIVDAALKR